jgi:diguanylate cyclase (GGDEF)-like protein
MAATDPRPFHQSLTSYEHASEASPGVGPQRQRGSGRPTKRRCLPAQELIERLDEEIGRASRHRTPLCCLLVRIDELHEISSDHGRALAQRALSHVGEAIEAELRRFDRVGQPVEDELIVVLPGAARPQGEAVARRALTRLRAIKIEVAGTRKPLRVSVGIAPWQEPFDAQQLIDQARRAAGMTRRGSES